MKRIRTRVEGLEEALPGCRPKGPRRGFRLVCEFASYSVLHDQLEPLTNRFNLLLHALPFLRDVDNVREPAQVHCRAVGDSYEIRGLEFFRLLSETGDLRSEDAFPGLSKLLDEDSA